MDEDDRYEQLREQVEDLRLALMDMLSELHPHIVRADAATAIADRALGHARKRDKEIDRR